VRAERTTLDTDILAYGVDAQAGPRHTLAAAIIEQAVRCECWLTLQAVSEFYFAVTRKRLMPTEAAAAQTRDWLDMFTPVPSSPDAMRAALVLAASGLASDWDALLLVATAAKAGRTAILTEGLSDGAMLQGVRIIHPFDGPELAVSAHVLLFPPP
jgi:predicted nucleic acid-binding protein